MKRVLDLVLQPQQAALWFLGQAGYVARAGEVTLAIDPYLTDSVGKSSPAFSRRIPSPLAPEELQADILIVTHDHTDHLDPETIGRYRHKESTSFVAPRFAARKLETLGVPRANITVVDIGEAAEVRGVKIAGAFALPTSADVLDTVGYRVEFANGRSFYHAGDTAFCDLLLRAAPQAEVLLVAINGKWGNLHVDEAIELAAAAKPRFALPNHYDVMALNSENPETFCHFLGRRGLPVECVIPDYEHPFIWE